jgi:hypothetical protein
MTAVADTAVVDPRQPVGRAVFAATIGNVLEWYGPAKISNLADLAFAAAVFSDGGRGLRL